MRRFNVRISETADSLPDMKDWSNHRMAGLDVVLSFELAAQYLGYPCRGAAFWIILRGNALP